MNMLKALAVAALVVIASVPAQAVNKIPLKPDSANSAPVTVWGTPTNGLAIGKTTANTQALDVVGNATVSGLLIVQKTAVGSGTGALGVYVSTTIPATSSFETLISSGGNITLTSTPSISTTTSVGGATNLDNGSYLILTSTAAAGTITLQDEGTLTGSLLQLGASTRAIGVHDTLTLIFNATTGYWTEVSFTNN